MPREARRSLGEQETHFSRPTKSVPYNLFSRQSSSQFDRPGPRNITLACLAAPRHVHGFSHNFFRLLSLPWALRPLPPRLQACKLAVSQAAANYLLPPSRLNASYHQNHNFVARPPTSRVLGTPLLARLSSIGDIRRASLCFCDVGRHAPYLVAGNCLPAPGLQSTTIISPSVYQA